MLLELLDVAGIMDIDIERMPLKPNLSKPVLSYNSLESHEIVM